MIRAQLELGSDSDVSMAEHLISSGGVPFCVETCYWAPEVTPRVPFVAEPGDDLPKSFELPLTGGYSALGSATVDAGAGAGTLRWVRQKYSRLRLAQRSRLTACAEVDFGSDTTGSFS